MKVLSVAVLLMASLAFVLVGCSDNSNSVVTPNEQTTSSVSLAKGNPVVHSATGNCGIEFEGKNLTFAFTAQKYADGSCSGEYEINTHSQDKAWGRWHGKVMSLEIWDGNTAVIGGIETVQSAFPGYYDAFVVIDNGEGKKPTGDMWTSTVFWDPSLAYAQQVWLMSPDLVYQEIVKEQASMGYTVTPEDFVIPIQRGNIQVR